jgi:hypothetical protein
MKSWIVVALAVVGAAADLVKAAETGPKGEVQNAIQRLAAQANYSWTSTVTVNEAGASARQSPTEGQTELNGYSFFKLKIGESPVEAAFRGQKATIKIEGEWVSAAELQGERMWLARRLSTFKPPAGEAQELLSKTTFMSKDKSGFYAELTANGVRELLALRSRNGDLNSVTGNPRGWVRFWLEKGLLTKYEFNLQGAIAGDNTLFIDVNRTTSVEIKKVGSTRVELPAEARKKLD